MRELLGDSEYGLITENSTEGLLAGMRRCLSESELRSHYSRKAAERGKAFSAKELTGQTEQFLESAYTEQSSIWQRKQQV